MRHSQLTFFGSGMCGGSFISLRCSVAYFSLVLNNIPLSGYTTVDLPIHLLKKALIPSKYWQLQIKRQFLCNLKPYSSPREVITEFILYVSVVGEKKKTTFTRTTQAKKVLVCSQPITVRKLRQQELEAANCICPVVRKNRVGGGCQCSDYFFHYMQSWLLVQGMVLPIGWVFWEWRDCSVITSTSCCSQKTQVQLPVHT